jgi:hypothetical protein
MEYHVKKFLFVLFLLIGCAFSLQAVEIPVSIAMEESLPYQKELHYHVVKAIADIENVKIVEPGTREWFRVRVLVIEMKLENQIEVGYAVSYTIVEVPFYLHAYIFESLEADKRKEVMDRLINSTVFYHGTELLTVGKEDLETVGPRIHSSLKKIIDQRLGIQPE